MDRISRRTALRAGVLGVGTTLAGCSGPAHLGTSELTDLDRDDEDRETHFTFRRGGEDQLTLSVLYHQGYRPSVNQLPLRLSTWHRDGTRLNSLRYHLFRADRAQEFSEFYLRTPGGVPFPELTLKRDRNGQGVHLDIPDLGFQGRGTVTLDFIIEPARQNDASGPFRLGVDAGFRLAETSPLGRDFEAELSREVELPRSG